MRIFALWLVRVQNEETPSSIDTPQISHAKWLEPEGTPECDTSTQRASTVTRGPMAADVRSVVFSGPADFGTLAA